MWRTYRFYCQLLGTNCTGLARKGGGGKALMLYGIEIGIGVDQIDGRSELVGTYLMGWLVSERMVR